MKKLSSIVFLLLSFYLAPAQDMTGLWGVIQVEAGGRDVTPVAKWFRLHADSSMETGNGWIQNGKGTWTYNPKTSRFTPDSPLGIKDEFGSFKVRMKSDTMIWSRMEEGMEVTVHAVRIEELPMAPADLIAGMWDLTQVIHEDKDVTRESDPDNRIYVQIGWDRIYRSRNASGDRETGFWHMNVHRPEITLLPHQEGMEAETWQVEVTDTSLVLRGVSSTNDGEVMQFVRIHHRPE